MYQCRPLCKCHFCAFWLSEMLLFFSCENVRSSLSPCLTLSLAPPSSLFLSLGSLPSEAFDWKHALFNHWGDSPCPVFAPLPRCNNKGRVTLSVSSRRDVWRREQGERMKEREKRGRARGREGEREWKQGLRGRGKAQGSIASMSATGRTSRSITKMEELKQSKQESGCWRQGPTEFCGLVWLAGVSRASVCWDLG